MCSLVWNFCHVSDWLVYIFFKVIQGPSPLDLNTELPYESTMKRKVRKKKKKETITANVAGTKFEIGRSSQIVRFFILVGKTSLMLKKKVKIQRDAIFYVMDF